MRQSFETIVKSKGLSERAKDILIAKDFPDRYEEWLNQWASPEWRGQKQVAVAPPLPGAETLQPPPFLVPPSTVGAPPLTPEFQKGLEEMQKILHPRPEQEPLSRAVATLYPDIVAATQTLLPEQRLTQAINSIQQVAQEDMDAYLEDIVRKGRSEETDYLLTQLFGATPQDIEVLFGGDDLEMTLGKVMPGTSLEDLDMMLKEDSPAFVEKMQTGGRTKEKESLLKMLGVSEAEIDELFGDKISVRKDSGWLDSWLDKFFPPAGGKSLRDKWRRTFVAGIGDVIKTTGGTARWLGFDGAGAALSNIGSSLQRVAPPDTLGEFDMGDLLNPDFYVVKVGRTIPFALSLLPLAIGGFGVGSAAATAIGLGRIGALIVGSFAGAALSRPLESALEAGGAYDDAIARNKTEAEAKTEADEVFKKNMFLGGSDAFQIAIALAPTPKWVPASLVKAGLVRTARIGGKTIIVGLSQGGEEVYQDMATRHAKGEEWQLDPISKEVFAIGMVMGVGMGLGGDLISGVVDRAQTKMSDSLKKKFKAKVKEFEAEGFRTDQSELKALDEISQTPEGEQIVGETIREMGVKEGILEEVPPVAPDIVESQKRAIAVKRTQFDELTIAKANDTEYRGLLSSLTRRPLRKGETWRIRAEKFIVGEEQRLEAIPEAVAAKEPWQMTQKEYVAEDEASAREGFAGHPGLMPDFAKRKSGTIAGHKQLVEDALFEGKPVPPEVLADYPDLARAIPKAIQRLDDTSEGLIQAGVRQGLDEKALRQGAVALAEADGRQTSVAYVAEAAQHLSRSSREREIILSQASQFPNDANAVDRARRMEIVEAIRTKPVVPKAEAVRPVVPEVAPPPLKEISPAEMETVMRLRREAGLEGPPPGLRVREEVAPTAAPSEVMRRDIEQAKRWWAERTSTERIEAMRVRGVELTPEQAKAPLPPLSAEAQAFIKAEIAPLVEEVVAPPPPEGATKRVFDRISFETAGPAISEKLRQGLHKFQVKMIDDLVSIKKFTQAAKTGGVELSIEENPYMLARLLKGVNSKATVFLEQGTFGKTFWTIKKGRATPNFTGESLEAILQEVKEPVMWQDFSTYLVARRSVELAARNIETGITESDAKAAINELETKNKGFPNLAERVYKYQDNLLVYGREMGLLSDDLLVKLRKYGNYVPFYRVFNELQAKGFMGKKMADIASPIKKIKGSEREILNPLESIVKNTYVLINAADRNRVGIMMANLVDKNPELADVFERVKTPMAMVAAVSAQDLGVEIEGLSVEDAEKVVDIFRPSFFVQGDEVTVLIDGKKAFFKVDPDLRDALLALDREDIGMLGKFLSLPAKWLRAGATLSPDFMVRNPARDQLTAFTYSNYGFLPGVDFLRGVAGIIRKDTDYQLFKLSGAEHSMLVSLDRQYLQTTFDEIVKGKKFTNYVKHPLELLQIISELGEKATRLGEFKAGIRRGAVPLEAGFSARNVTLDFAQSGTTAHAVNRLIAFFNANIRGQTKMLSAFKEHPVRTSAKVFGGITLPSILLYFANRDDDRWKEIPQWQKDLFWIVMTDDHIYRIPKPFELGILFGSIPERFLEWLDTKNPKIMRDVLGTAWQAGTPGFLPTAILPVIENMADYSFFRGGPIVPASRKDMPPELQYTQWTSEVSKKLGELLKLSPAKIDNLINGWTGGLGRYVIEILDEVLKGTGVSPDIPEPSLTLADLPVIKAFVVRSPYGSSGKSVNDFYDLLEKYEEGEKYLKEMLTLGEEVKFETYKAKHPELLFFYDFEKGTSYSASARYLRTVARELAEIRKKEDEIYGATDISPAEKRRLIDQLEKLKTEVSWKALALFPGKEPIVLQHRLSEAEDRLGEVISDVPLLSQDEPDIYDMRKLSADYARILETIKFEDLKTLKGIPKTVLPWFEKEESELALQAFLDVQDDKAQAKVDWLKKHPEDNARLALWGQEKVQSEEAFTLMTKWSKELGIPLAKLDSRFPPANLMDNYFALQKIVEETSPNSIEARLFKLEHPDYLKWGLEQGVWTDDLSEEKVEALRLQVKLKGMTPDTPEYIDTSRRIEAYRIDIPEDLHDAYVEYYQLPVKGYDRERFLKANQRYYEEVWLGILGNKPIDFTNVPAEDEEKRKKKEKVFEGIPR